MLEKIEIGARIKQRRLSLNLTQTAVAERVGVATSTIQRYENGAFDRVKLPVLQRIAEALNVNPLWLIGKSNDMEISQVPEYSNIIPLPATNKIPLIGDIACGTPILAEENVECYVDAVAHANADFALRCKGDSMIGARILDGDIVYIHQQPTVDNGEIAAVLIGEEATLKRVYINCDRVVLQPENPAYAPLIYIGEEMADVHIIGKAVSFYSTVK